jgi:hypothetical protein
MTTDQGTQTQTRILVLRLSGHAETLSDVTMSLADLDDLWLASIALVGYREGLQLLVPWSPPGDDAEFTLLSGSPEVISLTMRSPLLIELKIGEIVPAGLASAAIGLCVYFVRNPRRLGEFLPSVAIGWRSGWSEAERLKRDGDLLTNLSLLNVAQRMGVEEETSGELGDQISWLRELADRLEAAGPTVLRTEGIDEYEAP